MLPHKNAIVPVFSGSQCLAGNAILRLWLRVAGAQWSQSLPSFTQPESGHQGNRAPFRRSAVPPFRRSLSEAEGNTGGAN
ncbi:MAG: hypothetical protein AAGD25_25180 [Cyanobacteria bacterium P01_F01_bin.150]